jgi:ATP-binding cassette subfamily F protein 3
VTIDEPTNHLDIDSKEVLENALIDFDGTLLFVSHDRYFINRLATSIVELSPEGSTLYLGDYDYYVQKKAEQEELKLLALEEQEKNKPTLEPVATSKNHREIDKEAQKKVRQLSRQIEGLEAKMTEIEEQIEEIEVQLIDPEVFGDHVKVQEINGLLTKLTTENDALAIEWEEKSLALEELEN